MVSYKKNYLVSIFLTVILSLVYAVLLKVLEQLGIREHIDILSYCFIFIVGLISPLTFLLNGKFQASLEPTRPEINPNDGLQNQLSKELKQKASYAVSNNPNTKAREAKILSNNEKANEELQNEETITLYIANIPFKYSETQLTNLLNQFNGNIHFINLLRDKKTRRKKGIAFIKISKEAGEKAIESLNGTSIDGRQIVVKIANERNIQPE
ncbi:MAG: hypothetical protein UHG91_02135 [Succinivibrionaceae bacterium]|nr:hypothetical protein [Ruminobacter sp.]MDY5779315.1 hypothetical protein [Succinivibrionaceae bacterium]MEE1339566.1 hypothetical protein [Succinivibrionaceae bacterium]